MTQGARNLHALASVREQLEHEAATGECWICGEPSVGFFTSWDGHPRGVCSDHADDAREQFYTVRPDPLGEV